VWARPAVRLGRRLTCMHAGNYETQALVKSFEAPSTNDSQPMPVRYAKFVPRKQWIIAGARAHGPQTGGG